MKPYNERLPLIDAAIEATDGDIERIKDYRKTDTYINYTVKLGYFSVDSQWACHGETICTHDEYEQRARELGYKPKEQDMNDWYEKGELPPVGDIVECCFNGLTFINTFVENWREGDQLEVLAHRVGENGAPVAVVWNKRDRYATCLISQAMRPLRTETDRLVDEALETLKSDYATHLSISDLDLKMCAETIIEAGYRKVKPMSEDEFIDASELDHDTGLLLYRAGCRFLDQGE